MELSQGLVQKYRGGGEEGWAGAFGSVVDKKKKKKTWPTPTHRHKNE